MDLLFLTKGVSIVFFSGISLYHSLLRMKVLCVNHWNKTDFIRVVDVYFLFFWSSSNGMDKYKSNSAFIATLFSKIIAQNDNSLV